MDKGRVNSTTGTLVRVTQRALACYMTHRDGTFDPSYDYLTPGASLMVLLLRLMRLIIQITTKQVAQTKFQQQDFLTTWTASHGAGK